MDVKFIPYEENVVRYLKYIFSVKKKSKIFTLRVILPLNFYTNIVFVVWTSTLAVSVNVKEPEETLVCGLVITLAIPGDFGLSFSLSFESFFCLFIGCYKDVL